MTKHKRRRAPPLSPYRLMLGLIDMEYRHSPPVNMRKVKRRFRQRAHAIPGMVDKIITVFMDGFS